MTQAAYLHGKLSHEVFMKQPEGYQDSAASLVYKLRKNLYGLKQGANEFNKKLHDVLSNNDYKRSENDPRLYSSCKDNKWIYISIHVYDLVVASTEETMIQEFEDHMNSSFAMNNLCNLRFYLGLQFKRDEDGIFLMHQGKYIERKFKEFRLQDSKPSKIPVDPGYLKGQEMCEPFDNKEIYRQAIESL